MHGAYLYDARHHKVKWNQISTSKSCTELQPAKVSYKITCDELNDFD